MGEEPLFKGDEEGKMMGEGPRTLSSSANWFSPLLLDSSFLCSYFSFSFLGFFRTVRKKIAV